MIQIMKLVAAHSPALSQSHELIFLGWGHVVSLPYCRPQVSFEMKIAANCYANISCYVVLSFSHHNRNRLASLRNAL